MLDDRSSLPISGHSQIAACGLDNVGTVLLDGHGPKLQNDEVLAVKSLPGLSENYRAGAVEFDCNGSNGQDRQEKYEHE